MCLPPVSILLKLQVPPHSPWPPSTSGLVPVSQFLVFSPSCSLGEVRENLKHILRNLLSKLETNLRNHSLKALFSANRRECLLLLSYFYWRRQWHPTPELFCLENPMDEGAWWAAVHGVTKSRTLTEWLHFHFSLSCIGERTGNPLQCSCLESPRDGAAWWAAIYGVAQSWTQLKRRSSSSSYFCCVTYIPLLPLSSPTLTLQYCAHWN